MDQQTTLKFFSTVDAEKQLRELQKDLRFTVHEPTVELCVQKLKTEDYRIPEYQRKLTWDESRMSKFIESMLIGLPIPFIFGVAEESHDDKIAIIDGRQRLGTLQLFLENKLPLTDLEKLDAFEGFTFSDLSELQQRRLKNRPIRMVVLDGADPSTQFDVFERLNTTGKVPTRAEIRRGAFPGNFTDLVIRLAESEKFKKLTPMNEGAVDSREREELVLRLLCYSNWYEQFKHSVSQILDKYMQEMNQASSTDALILDRLESEFNKVCEFAENNLPESSFARGNRNQTPRVRFEALGVGIALALRQNPRLTQCDMGWIADPQFEHLTRSHASNSRPRLKERIEFARDKILENAR